jgi:GTP-binding protein
VADVEIINRELDRYRSELGGKPQILVATKADALGDPRPLRRLESHARRGGVPLFVVSAVAGTGIDRLVAETAAALERLSRGEPAAVPAASTLRRRRDRAGKR